MNDWHDWTMFRWGSSNSLLPKVPGVYAFVDAEGVVLYIGASKNIWNRVRKHEIASQVAMTGMKVYWKNCPSAHMYELEADSISALRPSMNQIPGFQVSTIAHYESGGSIAFCTTPEDARMVAAVREHLEAKSGVRIRVSDLLRMGVRALAEREGVK